MPAAIQDWVQKRTVMQQSVLFAAVRAPDGIHKNHPVKVLMRWYRRCILVSAFDRGVLSDPFTPGGGSFTGPFEEHHVRSIFGVLPEYGKTKDLGYWFDRTRQYYLACVDELPHHFQLHFMHSAQVIGYHHPDHIIRQWWHDFYLMIVNDAHLFPESKELMDLRLSDDPTEWRAREEVTAK